MNAFFILSFCFRWSIIYKTIVILSQNSCNWLDSYLFVYFIFCVIHVIHVVHTIFLFVYNKRGGEYYVVHYWDYNSILIFVLFLFILFHMNNFLSCIFVFSYFDNFVILFYFIFLYLFWIWCAYCGFVLCIFSFSLQFQKKKVVFLQLVLYINKIFCFQLHYKFFCFVYYFGMIF